MDIVIDTPALLAVIIAEPERDRIVEITTGHSLIGPGAIPWELGNAFSAMLKQKRLTLREARKGVRIFETIPIRYIASDIPHALAIAAKGNLYAYDAYFIDCALRHHAPLLTLDRKLKQAAQALAAGLLEV